MAENVTLEFISRQLDRVIADQAEMRDDIRVSTGIALRQENTIESVRTELSDVRRQIVIIVPQHQPFTDRLRRPEEQSAE